jgi:hypothetical protein
MNSPILRLDRVKEMQEAAVARKDDIATAAAVVCMLRAIFKITLPHETYLKVDKGMCLAFASLMNNTPENKARFCEFTEALDIQMEALRADAQDSLTPQS